MALAMHHPHTAHAAALAFVDVGGQRITRLVTGQAVQIDLALQRPVAAAQAGDHVGPDARAAKAQAVVGEQQGFERDLVAERGGQGGALVGLALARDGLGQGQAQLGQTTVRQRVHRPHGAGKQGVVLLLAARARGRLGPLAGLFGGSLGLGGLHRPAQCPQFGQALDSHCGREDTRARPRPGRMGAWPAPPPARRARLPRVRPK